MPSPVDLIITPQARDELAFLAARLGGSRVIPAVLWASCLDTGEPGWIVGFYDRCAVPPACVVDAGGLALAIEPQWRNAIAGTRLHFRDRFVFERLH